jgi:hypothetical protein
LKEMYDNVIRLYKREFHADSDFFWIGDGDGKALKI